MCRETDTDPAQIVRDRRIYEASLDELLKVVAEHAQDSGRTLLIGHNPGLETLLAHLSGDQPEPNHAGKVMTTAAIAVLDYGEKPVSIKKASARLLCLARPRD